MASGKAWDSGWCFSPISPDGSEVRLLGSLPRGSMAVFRLTPKTVSKAVAHRTVEEIWYFIAGSGRMWRTATSTCLAPLRSPPV